MKTLRDFLNESWSRVSNIPYKEPTLAPSLEQIRKSEWVPEFIEYMHNRMVMGFFRYGPISRQELNKYNFIQDIRRRLDLYEQDGNLEHLVDIGNEAMIQFFKGKKYLNQQFHSQDDSEHNIKDRHLNV